MSKTIILFAAASLSALEAEAVKRGLLNADQLSPTPFIATVTE